MSVQTLLSKEAAYSQALTLLKDAGYFGVSFWHASDIQEEYTGSFEEDIDEGVLPAELSDAQLSDIQNTLERICDKGYFINSEIMQDEVYKYVKNTLKPDFKNN